jgi:SAM-dependent methyltransferase
MKLLERGWARPTGLIGRIGGWEMAFGKAALNARVAELLAPEPGARVLELGCGPGTTIRALTDRTPAQRVVGVDPSPVMLAQARRRNRAGIAAGVVELQRGEAERLAFGDATFDAALTLHSLGHWTDRDAGLAALRRVLRPGARVVVALRAGWAPEAAIAALGRAGLAVDGPPERTGESLLLLAAAR